MITRILVTGILILLLFGISVAISLYLNEINTPPPSSFEECKVARGSVIQESYPPVCVSKDGKRFIKSIPKEEQELIKYLETTDTSVCGGIANLPCPEGYTCIIEDKYPDATGRCIPK
jgi:hypothetical protein